MLPYHEDRATPSASLSPPVDTEHNGVVNAQRYLVDNFIEYGSNTARVDGAAEPTSTSSSRSTPLIYRKSR